MPRSPLDARIRILHAALRLFASRGYYHTSIEDIIKESDCTRGALYYHFSSKKELGFAAIDEMLRLVVEQGAGRYLRTAGHPIDRMLKALDDLPTSIQVETGDAPIGGIAARMASVDEEFQQRLERAFGALIDQIEEILRRGIAEGQIVESVNARVLSHAFVVMGEGLQFSNLLGQREVISDDARRWMKEYLNSLRR